MKTVSEATTEIIKKSPFIEESIAEGLLNVSAYARKIKDQVEELTHKPVKEGAVVMAINRYSPTKILSIDRKITDYMQNLGDFTIRSGISILTYKHSDTSLENQNNLFNSLKRVKGKFFTMTDGVFETTFMMDTVYFEEVSKLMKDEENIVSIQNLATITIKLHQDFIDVRGAYYYILKQLAWRNINVVEILSTSNELTILVTHKDVEQAFAVLNRLKAGEII